MSKNEFLKVLALELRKRWPSEKAEEMIEDFNAHFNEALRAGKTEEEICEILGDPVEIAAQCGDQSEEPRRPGQQPRQTLFIKDAAFHDALAIQLLDMNLQCCSGEGEAFRIQVKDHDLPIEDRSIRVEEEGNRIIILQNPEDTIIRRFFRDNSDKTLWVEVPRQFQGSLQITMNSGNARVSELELNGKIAGKVGSGNINIAGVSSEKELIFSSGSGNIKVENSRGKITVTGASGNIKVSKHHGTVHASTASGNLHLETDRISEPTEMQTASGNLHLAVDTLAAPITLHCNSGNIKSSIRELQADLSAEVDSGNIVAVLSADTRAHFVLHTEGIHNAFDESGATPDGVPVVRLKSRSGSVRVEKQ